jgi:heparin binding hemagglutinin HbhA
MKVVTDIRKSAPAMAVLGVTDLAVGKLRSAQADLSAKASTLPGKAIAGAEALRAELTPAKIQADVQNLPNLAISKTLEVAGRAEETYGDLAARGKSLVDSVRRRSATKDLLAQGRSTVTLGKAAVTTVRKASDESLVAAKATLTAGRREVAQLAGSLVGEAQTEAKAAKPAAKKATTTAAKKKSAKATTSTRSAAKRTSTTATTRSANVKRATKATSTSARKTAAKAATAATTAATATGR